MMGRKLILMVSMLVSLAACSRVLGMDTEDKMFDSQPYVDAAVAVRKDDARALEKLIAGGVDVNRQSKTIRMPWGPDTLPLLTWATLNGSPKAALVLLKAGAQVNQAGTSGTTALMMAGPSPNDEVFSLLLASKADPNLVMRPGYGLDSALTHTLRERKALGEKRFARAQILLDHGADVNLDLSVDPDRYESALLGFGTMQDWRAVLWLLEHGADVDRKDFVGGDVPYYLCRSYAVNTLVASEAFTYRGKVRDWLVAHGVSTARLNPGAGGGWPCGDSLRGSNS